MPFAAPEQHVKYSSLFIPGMLHSRQPWPASWASRLRETSTGSDDARWCKSTQLIASEDKGTALLGK